MMPRNAGGRADEGGDLARRPCPGPVCLVWIDAEEALVARWDGEARGVETSASAPLTDRQLVARLWELAGEPSRRRIVGRR